MTRYRIEPSRSRVTIEARSSVHPIHSETDGLTGWLELDGDRARSHIELPVARLKSGNPFEDAELRRRIDAGRHPTIAGDTVAMDDLGAGRWRVSGDVTFRGVTRRCEGEVTVEPAEGGSVHVVGNSTFDVRDFGMEPPRILLLRVFPEVDVAIDIVAVPDAS